MQYSKAKVFLILLIVISTLGYSQRSARWKRMRYEIFYGLGATNFMGELGGANQIGTNYVRDFEISMTRPALSLGFRYKLLENVSAKAMLTYGFLRGDDKTTTEPARANRNLNFYSPLAEFALTGEYHITKERVGHRYNLKRVRGVRGFKVNIYFFGGVSLFWFNPKGKDANGNWHSLQPLGTEGQGLIPTREKYHRLQVAIPFGIGFKYGLDRKWSIGLEFGLRKTFTDYIDDVSTTYYNNDIIKSENGELAAYLADPSSGDNPSWTYGGEQRGDPNDKDSYMIFIVNLTYKLRTNRKGLPKF